MLSDVVSVSAFNSITCCCQMEVSLLSTPNASFAITAKRIVSICMHCLRLMVASAHISGCCCKHVALLALTLPGVLCHCFDAFSLGRGEV